MSMFNKNMKIGEGQKYDTTQVSTEGITAEERAEMEKKNRKMIDIFKAFDIDGDGSLNKLELAAAMDAFSRLDSDGGKDGKLSKKELKQGAEQFNEAFKDLGVNIEGKDLKAFLKGVRKYTKDDEKTSTQGVLNDYAAEVQAKAEAEAKAKAEAEAKAKAEAEAKAKAEAEAKAKAEAEAKAAKLATPTAYTIQPNERLDDLLKRSLEAQGKEVTDESLAEAKAEFVKNNPGALHGPKGKEYLYMGDVVKIPGGLEDKGNADEIKAQYRADQAEKRAKAEAKAKAEAEAKAKAEAEAKAKAEAEAKAKAETEARRRALTPKPYVAERSSTYVAPRVPVEPVAVKKAQPQKPDPKKLAAMNKNPLMEQLPNGYSRRDIPGFNDAYYDKDGNRITKETYMKARGKKDRKIDNMVAHPILEQLPNGYTKRDRSGPGVFYYDKQGNMITEAEYQRAKKAGH